MRDIVVLLGPPGAGKGTVAPIIKNKLGVPHLSTGQMLRAAVKGGSKIGGELKEIMASGKLVPNSVVLKVVQERICQKDCDRGFILDGFPRSLEQAKMLNDILSQTNESVTLVVEIQVPDEVLEMRICGRYKF